MPERRTIASVLSGATLTSTKESRIDYDPVPLMPDGMFELLRKDSSKSFDF